MLKAHLQGTQECGFSLTGIEEGSQFPSEREIIIFVREWGRSCNMLLGMSRVTEKASPPL